MEFIPDEIVDELLEEALIIYKEVLERLKDK